MTNHFDTVAQSWDQNPVNAKRTQAIAIALRSIFNFKEKKTAMEFGAGTGLLSISLRDLFFEITLLDSSSEMVRIAKEKLAKEDINHLTPIFFDLEKEDYTIKTFDIVFSQMALHHVLEVDSIISKFYKLLNPGGLLTIADLYKEDGTFHEFDFNGHKGFDPDELSKVFEKSGFREISYKPGYEIIKTEGPNKGKSYPIFLLTGKK